MKRSLSNSFGVATVTSNGGREHEIFFPRLRGRKPQQMNTVIGSVQDMRRMPLALIFISSPAMSLSCANEVASANQVDTANTSAVIRHRGMYNWIPVSPYGKKIGLEVHCWDTYAANQIAGAHYAACPPHCSATRSKFALANFRSALRNVVGALSLSLIRLTERRSAFKNAKEIQKRWRENQQTKSSSPQHRTKHTQWSRCLNDRDVRGH